MPGFELINKKDELREIQKIFNSGGVLFRQGFEGLRSKSYRVNEFENKFRKKFNTKFALAVSSGTAALRVALASLNIKKDDEVITQSFTFVATAEAIIECGAKPIFTEINQTLNMCPSDLKKKITKKTKAVIVVHMLGVPANLEEIKKICKRKKIFLIEDTAWGCGARYKNNFLGTHGDVGTFSFDFAKTITTGEGGMCVFKLKKHYLAAKAWHDHGHENNPKVPRWEDTRISSGFNFRMTELQGAVGVAQLKKIDYIISKQRENYFKIKKIILASSKTQEREIPKKSFISADAFVFFLENNNQAKLFRNLLLKEGISTKILPEACTWHFSKYWEHMKIKKSGLTNSEKILQRCVSLPIFIKSKNNFFKSLKKVIKKI